MTARTIALLALTAAVLLLAFMAGHKRGRWSRRFAHRDGYREGVKAEAARWEKVTGVTFGRLQAWRTGRGPDPFANLGASMEVLPSAEVLLAEADTALGKPPSVAEVDEMAAAYEAARAGGDSHVRTGTSAPGWPGAGPQAGDFSSRPSPAPGDAAWQPPQYAMDAAARYFGTAPPVVADLTGATAWHYPGYDVPEVTGTVVTGDPRNAPHPEPAGADWDRLAGRALPDYAAAALGGHRTVDECIDSIVMRAVGS